MEVAAAEPELSLKVMLADGVEGLVAEQLNDTERLFELVVLLTCTQEPEEAVIAMPAMSPPPSASLAVALA